MPKNSILNYFSPKNSSRGSAVNADGDQARRGQGQEDKKGKEGTPCAPRTKKEEEEEEVKAKR